MHRDEFEQLVSAWLDEPERTDLQARVAAAAADNPELAAALAQWRRVQDLLRGVPPPEDVDWVLLRRRLSAAVDESTQQRDAADAGLDAALRSLPGVEGRVDFPRLRGRISAAVAADARRRRRVRYARIASGVAAIAAAAVVALVLLPRGAGPEERTVPAPEGGIANVSIVGGSSGTVAAAASSGVAYARITPQAAEPQPEVLFVVDPRVPSPPSDDVVALY